jgi:hypothetical protein
VPALAQAAASMSAATNTEDRPTACARAGPGRLVLAGIEVAGAGIEFAVAGNREGIVEGRVDGGSPARRVELKVESRPTIRRLERSGFKEQR